VRIVGCDERHVQLARNRDQAAVDDVFFGHPMAHDLDVKTVAENFAEFFAALSDDARLFEQRRRDEARHAAGKHD